MDYERVSDRDWEEMVLKSDNAYFFSSPAWAKILEKSFKKYRTASRLYHVNGKSVLVPMMVKNTHGKRAYGFKSFESMPDEGLGGFFSESEVTSDEFQSIVKDIIGRKHTFYTTFAPFESISPGKSVINDEWNFKDILNYTHILNLDGRDFDDVWKNYKKRTRGHIRKAAKLGVEVRDGASLDDFREFYGIWSQASQNWEYQETHGFKFFRNLLKYGSPHVKLTLATKDDQTIAGLISLHYNKTIYLYFGAFLPEYGKYDSNRLLDNHAIENACGNDYKILNFGPCLNIKGIREYKEGFGAEEVEMKRYLVYSKGAKGGARVLDKYKSLMDHIRSG